MEIFQIIYRVIQHIVFGHLHFISIHVEPMTSLVLVNNRLVMPPPFSMGVGGDIVSPLFVRTSVPSVRAVRNLLVSVRYLLKGLVYWTEILYTGI